MCGGADIEIEVVPVVTTNVKGHQWCTIRNKMRTKNKKIEYVYKLIYSYIIESVTMYHFLFEPSQLDIFPFIILF